MHRQQALLEQGQGQGSSSTGTGTGGGAGGGAEEVDLAAMVGLLSDSGAMRDLDLNVRRDGTGGSSSSTTRPP